MEVLSNFESLNRNYSGSFLSMGNFDGVHKGHKLLLGRIREAARNTGEKSVVLTFHPHPSTIIDERSSARKITTISERLYLFALEGIDVAVVINFTKAIAETAPEDFLNRLFEGGFKPRRVVVGYDFRFGKDRRGGTGLLKAMADHYGYEVEEVSAYYEKDAVISSTRIRELIRRGELEEAANLMGHPFMLIGEVISGDGRGREMGYPTANIAPGVRLLPPDGVYALRILVNDRVFRAAGYIGTRPTFGESEKRLEFHLIDYKGAALYGSYARVEFLRYIRPDVKFTSSARLAEQIEKDIEEIRHLGNGYEGMSISLEPGRFEKAVFL